MRYKNILGSFHDHGRYICKSVVREKSLEQIHNNNQPFPFTLFMTYRCCCVLGPRLPPSKALERLTIGLRTKSRVGGIKPSSKVESVVILPLFADYMGHNIGDEGKTRPQEVSDTKSSRETWSIMNGTI